MATSQPFQQPGCEACPWLGRDELEIVADLGLPDMYHWGNMQAWTEKLLLRYQARISDARVVRQRFIRPCCVVCREPCEDLDPSSVIDPPVALPCGHIMGWTCYIDFCDRFKDGEGDVVCPWDGPTADEPACWSPRCCERVVHECDHPSMCTRVPAPADDFFLPPAFFVPPNGFVSRGCRGCTIATMLRRWTEETRQLAEAEQGDQQRRGQGRHQRTNASRVFATCSGIQGLLDGEEAAWNVQNAYGFTERELEHEEHIRELFRRTPAPMKGTELEEWKTLVAYKEPAVDVGNHINSRR